MNEKQLEEKLSLLDQLQSACTHCGLCSEACATFQSTGWEHESPRGRLQLANRFLHGNIQLKSDALSTFDRCLGCQACESLCPQKVSYHQVRQIIQDIRRDLKLHPSTEMTSHLYQQWMTLAYRVSNIRWRHYGAKWLKVPSLKCKSLGSYTRQHRKGGCSGQPILAVCCVQDLFQHEAISQALAFTRLLGENLDLDRHQPCCGAIFERLVHGGEESLCYPKQQQKIADLQNKTHQSFLKWMPKRLYFLSKGCQCHLSKGEDQTVDFYAWIESLLIQKNIILHFSEPRTVYYQPYCRSLKGADDSIWRLLHRIKGLTIREITSAQSCCGGYCGEALLHPESSQKIVKHKIYYLPQKATLIVTSPDCWGSFKNYEGNNELKICYPVQILMEASITHLTQHGVHLN